MWLTKTLKVMGEVMEREGKEGTAKDGGNLRVSELKAKETSGCS